MFTPTEPRRAAAKARARRLGLEPCAGRQSVQAGVQLARDLRETARPRVDVHVDEPADRRDVVAVLDDSDPVRDAGLPEVFE